MIVASRYRAVAKATILLGLYGCRPTPQQTATVASSPPARSPAAPNSGAADLSALARTAANRPEDAKAQARYGSALVEAGKAKDGIARLRRAVALDPGLTAAWHNLGLAAERQGWLDMAADAYARVVAAKPDIVGEWVKLGYVLIALGRFDEAEHAFQKASVLQPRSSETLVALASSYYAHFRFNEALDTLQRAAAVNPRSVAAYVNTAAIQIERRKFPEAEAAIRSALQIEPDTARYHLILGRVLAASPLPEKRAEGRRELEELAIANDRLPGKTIIDRSGAAEALYLLGQLARDDGDQKQAVSRWRRAIDLAPDHSETLLALGQALVREGDSGATEGREMLRQYERLQRLRDRGREIQQYTEEHPADGTGHLRFGTLLLEQGNVPRAVWELREAARLRPQDTAARSELAGALRRQGRYEAADAAEDGIVENGRKTAGAKSAKSETAR